jgi:hypothetical protein
MANLALLQLMLLGSGALCTTPMADAGPHAGHAAEHRGAGVSGAEDHAVHDGERYRPATDCGLRACTISPVLLEDGVSLAPAPSPAAVDAAIDGSPASPARVLDPPPPRA